MYQPCLDESTQGGNQLGVTTCAYHAYNCAELQCINLLCYQAQKSSHAWCKNGAMSDKVKHHMECVLSTAKEELMEAAQRSGLIASYNPEENFWSLADDENAAAITAAGSSEGVTQDTPTVESYDKPVLQGQVFNRLWNMSRRAAAPPPPSPRKCAAWATRLTRRLRSSGRLSTGVS